jgi:hypothetical protein
MNRIATRLAGTALILLMTANAYADSWHRGRHHRPDNDDWIAPLVFLGVLGAVAAATSDRPEPRRSPGYAPPPDYGYPSPRSELWYYCEPARQYYPYVQSCPAPWIPVPPTPR